MNTPEVKLVRVEVAADLPVLWACLERLDFVNLCDRYFPKPLHWQGNLSVGQVVALCLLSFASQGDHRLVHIEAWALQHQITLSALLVLPLRPKDLHDDRIADILSRFGSGDAFANLETDLNKQTIRVYGLDTDCVRLDTTTASTHLDVLSDKGLIQFGHSKDDPTRPQLKIATAVLDPLGMPLCTVCLPGNTADDPTYIPSIQSVQRAFGRDNRLYVGDCKMAALLTRLFLVSTRERYLCPLSEKQLSQVERLRLLEPVLRGEQPLQAVSRPAKEASEAEELVARGFEVPVRLQDPNDPSVEWTERRFVVQSLAYARSGELALQRKLSQAVEALEDLPVRRQGKKVLSLAELGPAAAELIKGHGVQGLLRVEVQRREVEKEFRGYRGQPGRVEREEIVTLTVVREEEAIALRQATLGWQVYATNDARMSLSEVVWAYRGQYRVEDAWKRLKGETLNLTPLYLQDEDRIQGLVHLLSVVLRMLTLLGWVVREKLAKEEEDLRGLYAGQAGRKTRTPSAELLLRAFQAVSLTVLEVGGQIRVLLTPLTPLQQHLLELLDLPPDLYDRLTRFFSISPQNTSEP